MFWKGILCSLILFCSDLLPPSVSQTFWIDIETANLTTKPTVMILGKNSSRIGPFYLGERVNLACVIKTHDTLNEINAAWTLASVQVASHAVYSRTRIISSLSILPKRNHHLQKLCCIALLRDLYNVQNDCATIEIIAPPQSIQIDVPSPLLEGVPSEVHCLVHGSRPPPAIWWTLHQQNMAESVFRPGEPTSLSVLVFTPEASQKGLRLECRAANPQMPHKQIEEHILLQLIKGPEVHLSLGRGLNASRIKRGSDIFFECRLLANLPDWIPKRDVDVTWFKDETPIQGHSSTSVDYLVLRNVTFKDEGHYSCQIESQLHKRTLMAASNRLTIKVQYPPRCRSGRSVNSVFVDMLDQRQVVLRCDVENSFESIASPKPDLFKWKIGSRVFLERNSSLLIEDVRDLLHHSVQCWASNWVGFQHSPCVFYLLPKPEDPANKRLNRVCQITESAQFEIEVGCTGNLGFVMAKEVHSGRVVYGRHVDGSRVRIRSLSPGTLHLLNVGGSLFHVSTAESPSSPPERGIDQWGNVETGWAIVAACLVLVVSASSAIILVLRRRVLLDRRWNKNGRRCRQELGFTIAQPHCRSGSSAFRDGVERQV